MTKGESSEMKEIAKKELDGRGYIVRLSTKRDGDSTIGRVHVLEAGSDKTVAKLVSVIKLDNLELVFGVDVTEGIARDLVSQAMSLADLLRFLVPGFSMKEE
ncbi:MAG: hypothetical protein A3K68_06990 [Euryarchaeota archaeon RBG_16_68_13]|nr:MAG: hypothetical protein A3K68_06990 [Euryarchaeota archaeon RBG_16_68_13]